MNLFYLFQEWGQRELNLSSTYFIDMLNLMYRYLYYVTILGIILMITDNIREN